MLGLLANVELAPICVPFEGGDISAGSAHRSDLPAGAPHNPNHPAEGLYVWAALAPRALVLAVDAVAAATLGPGSGSVSGAAAFAHLHDGLCEAYRALQPRVAPLASKQHPSDVWRAPTRPVHV